MKATNVLALVALTMLAVALVVRVPTSSSTAAGRLTGRARRLRTTKPNSLQECIAETNTCRPLIMIFAEKQSMTENLQFFMAAKDYQRVPNEHTCKGLYNNFMKKRTGNSKGGPKSQVPYEVNLAYGIQQRWEALMASTDSPFPLQRCTDLVGASLLDLLQPLSSIWTEFGKSTLWEQVR